MTKENKYHKLYLDIAKRISEMSFSTRRQVGCCIVKDNNIISFGWNGTAAGRDNCCEDSSGKTKPEVIHAEMNAFSKILKNSTATTKGATVYLTLSPCWDCSKVLVQSGISKVIFLEEYTDHKTQTIPFLIDSGIQVYLFENGVLKQY